MAAAANAAPRLVAGCVGVTPGSETGVDAPVPLGLLLFPLRPSMLLAKEDDRGSCDSNDGGAGAGWGVAATVATEAGVECDLSQMFGEGAGAGAGAGTIAGVGVGGNKVNPDGVGGGSGVVAIAAAETDRTVGARAGVTVGVEKVDTSTGASCVLKVLSTPEPQEAAAAETTMDGVGVAAAGVREGARS